MQFKSDKVCIICIAYWFLWKISYTYVFARITFLKAIGIYTNQTQKSLLLKYFFTGNKTMTSKDMLTAKELVQSELFQKEFCRFIFHTGRDIRLIEYSEWCCLQFIIWLTNLDQFIKASFWNFEKNVRQIYVAFW